MVPIVPTRKRSFFEITECPIVFIAITPKSQIPSGFPIRRAMISPKTIGLNSRFEVSFHGIHKVVAMKAGMTK